MPRIFPLFTLALLGLGFLASCNHDTDQLSTESPSTRNSTAANPDSSSLATDSSTTIR